LAGEEDTGAVDGAGASLAEVYSATAPAGAGAEAGGAGWGWRGGWMSPYYPPPPYSHPPFYGPYGIPPEEEIRMLEEEKAFLEQRLEEINRRLKELKE